MRKELLTTRRKGFSLVEAILASALFALVISAIIGGIIYGRENTALSGERSRAVFIAEEGMEAVRNIRDEDFTSLADGTYGLDIVDNKWTFSGSSDTVDDFTRTIQISTVDSNTKEISANISWQQNELRTGDITLTTYLTDWAGAVEDNEAAHLVVDTTNAQVGGKGNKSILGITIENTGPDNITIDRIAVFWAGGASGNSIQGIVINGSSVWSGDELSGAELDITDFTLVSGYGTYPMNSLDFNKNIVGATVSLTFIMSDSSSKVVPDFTL